MMDETQAATTDTWAAYWEERFDLLYYQAVDFVIRTIGADARSLVDVGTGGCPYLEWFHWIERRVSIDIRKPYGSATVEGMKADILRDPVPDGFDLCTCLQVLEHVPQAGPFAQRLTELARTVVVSVPYQWPPDSTQGHVHDPVDLDKLAGWFGRPPNYHLIVEEPLRRVKNKRLVAIFDADRGRKFGSPMIAQRRRRTR